MTAGHNWINVFLTEGAFDHLWSIRAFTLIIDVFEPSKVIVHWSLWSISTAEINILIYCTRSHSSSYSDCVVWYNLSYHFVSWEQHIWLGLLSLLSVSVWTCWTGHTLRVSVLTIFSPQPLSYVNSRFPSILSMSLCRVFRWAAITKVNSFYCSYKKIIFGETIVWHQWLVCS